MMRKLDEQARVGHPGPASWPRRPAPRRGRAHHAVELEVQDAAQHLAQLRARAEAQLQQVLAADRQPHVARHVEEAPEALGGDARTRRAPWPRGRPRAARRGRARRARPRSARGPRGRRAAGPTTSARSSTSASSRRMRMRSHHAAISSGSRSRSIHTRRRRHAAPRRRGACARRSSSARRTSSRVPGVDAQPPVDRRRQAELLHAPQREVDLLLVEQATSSSRRRADERSPTRSMAQQARARLRVCSSMRSP